MLPVPDIFSFTTHIFYGESVSRNHNMAIWSAYGSISLLDILWFAGGLRVGTCPDTASSSVAVLLPYAYGAAVIPGG